jgi:hypothetical protein
MIPKILMVAFLFALLFVFLMIKIPSI